MGHSVCILTMTSICLVMSCAEVPIDSLSLSALHLSVAPSADGIFADPSFTYTIGCDNVYNTGLSNDWTQSNRTVSNSISIPQGKVCRLSLSNYFDGTTNFTPVQVNVPLVITVSTTGLISASPPAQYSNGSTLQWFSAIQNGAAYTVKLNTALHTLSSTTSLSPTAISLQSFNLANDQVSPPSVTNVRVTQTRILVVVYYTLTAVVTNSSGCKYINNSGVTPPYNVSDWTSVNTAYNSLASNACPIMVPGSPLLLLGNWTSLWQPGIKTLVMWANTVNGVNAYTTAMVGP